MRDTRAVRKIFIPHYTAQAMGQNTARRRGALSPCIWALALFYSSDSDSTDIIPQLVSPRESDGCAEIAME